MAKINMLNAWSGSSEFSGRRSAQGYLNAGKASFAVSGSCGSACGAGDDKKDPKPVEITYFQSVYFRRNLESSSINGTK